MFRGKNKGGNEIMFHVRQKDDQVKKSKTIKTTTKSLCNLGKLITMSTKVFFHE